MMTKYCGMAESSNTTNDEILSYHSEGSHSSRGG